LRIFAIDFEDQFAAEFYSAYSFLSSRTLPPSIFSASHSTRIGGGGDRYGVVQGRDDHDLVRDRSKANDSATSSAAR